MALDRALGAKARKLQRSSSLRKVGGSASLLVDHGWSACFSDGAAFDGQIGASAVGIFQQTNERGEVRSAGPLVGLYFTLTICGLRVAPNRENAGHWLALVVMKTCVLV